MCVHASDGNLYIRMLVIIVHLSRPLALIVDQVLHIHKYEIIGLRELNTGALNVLNLKNLVIANDIYNRLSRTYNIHHVGTFDIL